VATGDLTTLASVKAYLHISGTAQDTFLTSLITLVTARIQKDCGRIFLAGNYIETHNIARGQTRVIPFNKPIIQMNRVAWGNSSAFQITYSGAAVAANAQVTPARQLILTTYDSSGANTTTIDLTNVAYSVCSQVVAQINTVSGFNATLYANIDAPTRWLFPSVNLTLKSYNSLFTQGFGFASVDIFTYTIDPTYNTIGFQPFTLADFIFDRYESGGFAWPGMYQGLMLDYRGGYETIPPDVDLLCQQVVADIYNQSLHDNNLTTETLGDYTYALADMMLRRQYYADILAPYRRPQMAGGMA
jgi:hypothetical protein